jgi:hypothetical protein
MGRIRQKSGLGLRLARSAARSFSPVSGACRPVLAETAESFGLVLRSTQLRGAIGATDRERDPAVLE